MKIYITAIFKVKTEFLIEVKSFLQEITRKSQGEKACLHYVLHQSITDPNTFFLYEAWENREGLNQHNLKPYFGEFIRSIEGKILEQIVIEGASIEGQ